ncbi:hypothetical protein EV401DRAFT_402739 [Pisolithus croceorrhizus]|nr:hypothetical protein EV401DRAFT_402739 [Pisolithus croceorrhizus]
MLHRLMPTMITFAFNESKLLIGLADNSIVVYEADHLCSAGDVQLAPVHAFPAFPSVTLLSIHPNPEGLSELVAVLRDCSNSPGSLTVELLDVQKLASAGGWIAGNSPSTVPTAISWSPKGKQLALGMQGGDIVTYNPIDTATPKCSIPRPPSANGMSVISVHWLSTCSFHAIYAPAGKLAPDSEQAHFHVSLDSKANSAQDLRFNPPYFPFPALRPPGSFAVILKNWDPYKAILFLGDSTSSDIGVIGAITDGLNEHWHNLSLEETSTPNLPLDKDQNDTVLIGHELDLTNTESYRHTTASGEPLDLPPPPIMYAYASDGTVLGWYLLNTSGNVYHGMVKQTAAKETTMSLEPPPVATSIRRAPSTDMQTTPSVSPSAPVSEAIPFGQQTSTPHQPAVPVPSAPSGLALQTSPFGTPSSSAFTQTPTFGQSSFDRLAASASSAFSQASPPTFGSASATSGFGAFSSPAPAKFGPSGFGFGFGSPDQSSSVASAPTAPDRSSEISQEDGMVEDGPSLDGLGLGGLSGTRDADSKSSIFGNTATPTSFQQPSSSGGNEGLIKSGVGFGAALDQNSPFAKPSSFASGPSLGQSTFGQTSASPFATSKLAFGQTGFEQPAFGQSGFGQPAYGQLAFGQTGLGENQTVGSGGVAFGKSSFGSPSTTRSPPDVPAASTSGGAFGAFAMDGTTAFAAFADKVAKPVWAVSEEQKNPPEKPRALFGPSTSSLVTAPEPALAKAEPARIIGEQTKPTAALPSLLFSARESALRQPESRSPSPIGDRPSSSPTTTPKPAMPAASFGSGDVPKFTTTTTTTTTTPTSTLKPATGFLGGMPKESPFFPPKQTEPKSVSAFALSGTPAALTTPTKPSVAAPTFGAPSIPSTTPRSVFGTPAFPSSTTPTTTTTMTTPPAPATGAFSSFASGGGFSAFAGSGTKSFSDLLKSGGQEPVKEGSVFSATLTKEVREEVSLTSTTPISTPVPTPAKEVKRVKEGVSVPLTPSVSVSLSKPAEELPSVLEVSKPVPEISTEALKSEDKIEQGKPATLLEPSFEIISSSTTSSFVDVSLGEGGREGEGKVIQETAEPDGEEEDESRLFLSDVPSESEEESELETEEEEESEKRSEGEEGQEEDQEEEEINPTDVPLPSTPTLSATAVRSRSTTPKAELPKLAVSDSPSPSPSPQSPTTSVPRVSPIRELGTTTPPSSPVKEAERIALSVPVSKPPLPAGSPFNLPPRVGTNNRPIRSSPLASTPLVGELDTLASPTPPPPSKSTPPVAAAPVDQWRASVKNEEIESLLPEASTLLSAVGSESRPAFGVTPLPAPAPTTPAPLCLASFSAPTVLSSFVTSPPASTLFGTPAKTPPPPEPITPFTLPSSPLSTSSLQSVGITPPSAGILPVSGAPVAGFSHPVSMFPPPVTPVSTPPTLTPEQGMQAECLNLLSALTEEFESLQTLATAASQKAANLRKSSGIVHTQIDLLDSDRWVVGDIKEYGRVLLSVQDDIRALQEQRVVLRRMLQELDGCMLKAITKQEEIIRFDKARTDAEFAKMLKVRTLGPEYLEVQTQDQIYFLQAIRDRVQKLEDHLQASKRKLQEFKTGKPRFRPPSIDTINRTLRNIDLAIGQQQREVDELLRRINTLDISSASDGVSSSSREKCLVVSQTKRSWNVTPNVAASTAAALNAERAAQKLKRALLASRDSPLLNSGAKVTTSKLTSFRTPQKTSAVKPEKETPAPGGGPFSLPAMPMMTLPSALPTWSPASPSDIGDSPSQNTLPSRHRGSTKHHQKPIALKKSNGSLLTGATAGTLSFDWGPVQPIKPMTSLAFDLRQRTSK